MATALKHPLTSLREDRQVGVTELALAVGCDKSNICRIEGFKKPSPELANRIEQFFKVEGLRDKLLFPEDYVSGKKKPSRSVRPAEAV